MDIETLTVRFETDTSALEKSSALIARIRQATTEASRGTEGLDKKLKLLDRTRTSVDSGGPDRRVASIGASSAFQIARQRLVRERDIVV